MPAIQLDYIHIGDVFGKLKLIPSKSCRTCVTSPPYYGLRDYGTGVWEGGDPNCKHRRVTNMAKDIGDAKRGQENGYAAKVIEKGECRYCGAVRIDQQIGLEKTPEEFIEKLVAVFQEIRRILTDDGTLWINIGDSYWGGKGQSGDARADLQQERLDQGKTISRLPGSIGEKNHTSPLQGKHSVIKPKDLIGIPWMLAFALRADGWYLRSDCIWAKPNPMPESVTDRPTKSHEYFFLFSKSKKYYYDHVAVLQPLANSSIERQLQDVENQAGSSRANGNTRSDRPMKAVSKLFRSSGNLARKDRPGTPEDNGKHQKGSVPWEGGMANKKTVWTVATKPFSEAHFATFPEDLIVDPIKAGTSEHGQCSHCHKPWRRMIEKEYHKHENWFGDKQSARNNRGEAGNSYNEVIATNTVGWEPTCHCNATVIPDVVIDPFMGAATTGLVAKKLNRNFIGVELNKKYAEEIAIPRLRNELGMFYTPQKIE